MRLGSVRGIIEHQGKFLLVKNEASNGAFWCLPGGGLEQGENIFLALKRELVEELNVEPEIGNLIYIHQTKKESGYSNPGFYFHIKNNKDFLNYDPAASTHGGEELVDAGWVNITEVKVLPKTLGRELPEIAQNNFDVKPSFIIDT